MLGFSKEDKNKNGSIAPILFSLLIISSFVFLSIHKKQSYKDVIFRAAPASALRVAHISESKDQQLPASGFSSGEEIETKTNYSGSGYEDVLGPGFKIIFPEDLEDENVEEKSVVIQQKNPKVKQKNTKKSKASYTPKETIGVASTSKMIDYNEIKKTLEEKISQSSKQNNTKQFVAISFDGSKSIGAWRRTRDHATRLRASGVQVRFTYFISGVYFMENISKKLYRHPALVKMGSSNIGFGGSLVDINERRRQVNVAVSQGHEVGSHAVGHFDGSGWLVSSWDKEFKSFNDIVFKKDEKFVPLSVSSKDMKGFRAPFLGNNGALYSTLAKNNYTYDASKVAASSRAWPKKNSAGIWEFSLPIIKVGSGNVLAMDYNLYYYQTKAKSRYKRGTSAWISAYNDVYMGYVNYFLDNYNTTRAPINIGHHFSLWNDGVYWQALADFSETVCGVSHVDCGTYSELVEYMENR